MCCQKAFQIIALAIHLGAIALALERRWRGHLGFTGLVHGGIDAGLGRLGCALDLFGAEFALFVHKITRKSF